MSKKIILKGYYGWGNLGDDLLFLVSWRWVRKLFPDATILACTESNQPNYLSALVDEPVNTIRNHEPVSADVIIHGGGGIYFDFKQGPSWRLLLNGMARMMGASLWRSAYAWLRNGKRISARKRLGIGIGFGSYTMSSDRYAADLAEIASFDLLIVRDPMSAAMVRHVIPAVPVTISTDLVFLTNLWLPQTQENSKSRVIGFILRDWPRDNNEHHASMKSLADALTKSGHEVRCYSLDPRADVGFIAAFEDFNMQTWQPGKTNLGSFLSELAGCSVVVTSRAHGAIVSAALGISSICLEIEPKLATISNMLAESSTLVKPPYSVKHMEQLIDERMSRKDELGNTVRLEVERNRVLMEKSLAEVEKLLSA